MSVIVIGRLAADPATMKKLWADRAADFVSVAAEAKAAGALHHRWALGEDNVVLVDEWPDAESFQKFFSSNTTIPALMQSGGVQGIPEFEIMEAADAPDEF
jgi:hypothetical protein